MQFIVLENYNISITNSRARIYANSLGVFVCVYIAGDTRISYFMGCVMKPYNSQMKYISGKS